MQPHCVAMGKLQNAYEYSEVHGVVCIIMDAKKCFFASSCPLAQAAVGSQTVVMVKHWLTVGPAVSSRVGLSVPCPPPQPRQGPLCGVLWEWAARESCVAGGEATQVSWLSSPQGSCVAMVAASCSFLFPTPLFKYEGVHLCFMGLFSYSSVCVYYFSYI